MRWSLESVRQRQGDWVLTALTVLLLLMMFVFAPLQASGFAFAQGLGVLVGVVLIGGAIVLSGSVPALFFLLIAFLLSIAVGVARLLGQKLAIDLYLLATAWVIFALTLGWVVGKAVFGPGRVNFHRIVGAVFLYLLAALLFAALFLLVGLLFPKAFTGLTVEDSYETTSNLFYFSLVTLTSTGYGDIVPVHPLARSLCNLETILGQLYPATLLARLVSLEIAARQS